MLSLQLEEFMVELKDGSIKNVGPTNKAAEAKLFDVSTVEVRGFGDKRVKLAFADEEGNEVEIALSPDQAREVGSDIEDLEADSPVFE